MSEVQQLFPYLRVHAAADAIAFYEKAFGGEELFRLTAPDGRIGHAQVRIGAASIMLADEAPEHGFPGPRSLGGTSFSLHLHLDDVDAGFARAVEAGATVLMAPKDQFWGERQARLRDPFGHEWLLGGHVDEVTPEEMQARYTATAAS